MKVYFAGGDFNWKHYDSLVLKGNGRRLLSYHILEQLMEGKTTRKRLKYLTKHRRKTAGKG